jgi:putative cardiolipin synthase
VSLRPGLSSGANLHAKAVVVDRRSVLVASMNLDPRSRLLNTEIGVPIDSATLGAQIGALFDEATDPEQAFGVRLATPGDESAPRFWDGRDGGKPVRYDREPLAGWWRKLLAELLDPLAPEELR